MVIVHFLPIRSRIARRQVWVRCGSSVVRRFCEYRARCTSIPRILVCSPVYNAGHNFHHFVRTTSPFEFLVEIPRFVSQVTLVTVT